MFAMKRLMEMDVHVGSIRFMLTHEGRHKKGVGNGY